MTLILLTLKRISLVVIFLLCSACSTINPVELANYNDIYTKTQESGDLILDQVASVMLSDDGTISDVQRCEVDPKTGFRPCFYTGLAKTGKASRVDEPVDIKVRRLSLGIIGHYNALLLAQVEGKSAQEINQRLEQFVAVYGSWSGLTSAANLFSGLPMTGIKKVINELEGVRADYVSAQSLVAANADIHAMIDFIIQDTPVLYKIYIAQFNGKLGKTKIALKRAQLKKQTGLVKQLQQKLKNLQNPNDSANKAQHFELALIAYIKMLDLTDKTLTELVSMNASESKNPLQRMTFVIERSLELRVLADQLASQLKE
ncbi:MAG: hypothetical protein ACI9ES_002350 [Oceanospirillaceae bacterium]|jgi:hypothetical protein